ncbi:MAG: sensor histidine kinase [Oscillospiraceae bacterium]|nr:sensor histidine kinase [Oscillospiraceae bacterium]
MKKLYGSFAAKLVAVLLLCALAVVFGLSMVGVSALSRWDAFNGSLESVTQSAVENLAWNEYMYVWDQYQSGLDPQYISHDVNFRFTLIDPEGKQIYSDYHDEPALWHITQRMQPNYSVERNAAAEEYEAAMEYPAVTPPPIIASEAQIVVIDERTGERAEFQTDYELEQWRQARSMTMRGYVLAELTAGGKFAQRVEQVTALYRTRYALVAAAGLSFLMGVLLFIFLMAAAGHHGDAPVRESFVDRIPLDVFTLLAISAAGIALIVPMEMGLPGDIVGYTVFGLCLLAAALIALLYCMSFAVRVKCGTLWQNCLIARIFRRCRRTTHRLWELARDGLRALPLIRRWAVILGGVALVELFVMLASEGDCAGLLWFVNLVLGVPAMLWALIGFARLRAGAGAIAGGDLNYTVDTRYLRGELLEHAGDLNHIRDGLNAAVAERMKSQHFQSELITNVSHDIKTPLTNIISYVDLLEKEELQNDTARGYVEVLSRQSQRLKKLLDDLLEASKASTGVLPVSLERCELGVLLDQCVGEYGERLQSAGLNLVVSKPEEPVTILADGRHLWRVFDNLLSNVLKYAQPGTRVYLNLAREGGQAVLTFRNISREALNLNGEELLARFVRGDSARSTEGSGLGLAIAQSLTALQGGEMTLDVDGDLFKVTLRFEETK